jgi:hypothetical protein
MNLLADRRPSVGPLARSGDRAITGEVSCAHSGRDLVGGRDFPGRCLGFILAAIQTEIVPGCPGLNAGNNLPPSIVIKPLWLRSRPYRLTSMTPSAK